MNRIALSRRRLLGGVMAGGAGLVFPWLGAAPAAASEWVELAPELALVRGMGGNVLVSRGGDGVMMVDGGQPRRAGALLEQVEARYGARPQLLFNTHCHRGQCGSNPLLGPVGATIVAHENTRLWLGTDIVSEWEDRTYPPLPEEARPNRTFFHGSESLDFNGMRVEYGYLPQAHTDGDIYIFLPERNVLAVGDVVAGAGYPLADYVTGGWLGGMIDSLELLLDKSDAETRIIAGTGAVLSRERLEAQLELCNVMVRRMAAHYYEGGSFREFVAGEPTREFDAQWGDPALFLRTAWEGVWYHINEVRRFR